MKQPLIVYWSRRDFRITDNPALTRAATESRERGVPFLPLFILEDYMVEGNPVHQFGYPSRWFLAHALPEFAKQFAQFALVEGKAAQYLIELGKQYEMTLFVNDDVYPDFNTQVEKIEAAGMKAVVCSDALTVSKETRTGQGNVYSVFTPFKKAVWADFVKTKPLPKVDTKSIQFATHEILESLPNRIEAESRVIMDMFSDERSILVGGTIIDVVPLVPVPELSTWYVSEEGAHNRFSQFLASHLLGAYDTGRDSLEDDAVVTTHEGYRLEGKTSRMSLALAWGLISSRTLMSMIRTHFGESFDNPFSDRVNKGALTYISELIWREFYRYLFVHNPSLMHTEFQERFRGTIAWVPFEIAHERFVHWIKGETGYPVVDAAMHQIARTGWMHNRARMIVASILTKNLGVDWRWGQEYFRAALLDLDEASNNGGWQWGASVGADPKPIRIFNPELQAKNYDGSGRYQAKWLTTPDTFLKSESIPLIEHRVAREEALLRYGLKGTEPRDY
jgi:deoxyribodipyrimidine photo-lyase